MRVTLLTRRVVLSSCRPVVKTLDPLSIPIPILCNVLELEAKLANKNEVLVELMEEYVALKKSLGDLKLETP